MPHHFMPRHLSPLKITSEKLVDAPVSHVSIALLPWSREPSISSCGY
jgi:hypothetical protein